MKIAWVNWGVNFITDLRVSSFGKVSCLNRCRKFGRTRRVEGSFAGSSFWPETGVNWRSIWMGMVEVFSRGSCHLVWTTRWSLILSIFWAWETTPRLSRALLAKKRKPKEQVQDQVTVVIFSWIEDRESHASRFKNCARKVEDSHGNSKN